MAKRKQTAWNRHLMSVWHEMQKKDPEAKLKDAMKKAKYSYKG